MEIMELEQKLNDKSIETRLAALKELKQLADAGKVKLEPKNKFMNLHCHTFHSFNAFGYSPGAVAWVCYKLGLDMMGTVDFDVIDSLEETMQAGKILGLKTVVGIESRVYIKEYADKVINSPNEPGVCYFCGIGFYKKPVINSFADITLKKIFNIAKQRNVSVLGKLNPFLSPVTIDYENDLVLLTASGNATERHILKAYYEKSKAILKNTNKIISFWAERLGTDTAKVTELMKNEFQLYELMRAKLIKYGSIGYVKPEPKNFPTIEEMIKMIRELDALPSLAFLDGTSEGEADISKWIRFIKSKGVNVVTLIPDRNFNIKDEAEKKIKVDKLNEFFTVCREEKMYIIPGTEMNKAGQKLVDNFNAPELKPYLRDFIAGAEFVYSNRKELKG